MDAEVYSLNNDLSMTKDPDETTFTTEETLYFSNGDTPSKTWSYAFTPDIKSTFLKPSTMFWLWLDGFGLKEREHNDVNFRLVLRVVRSSTSTQPNITIFDETFSRRERGQHFVTKFFVNSFKTPPSETLVTTGDTLYFDLYLSSPTGGQVTFRYGSSFLQSLQNAVKASDVLFESGSMEGIINSLDSDVIEQITVKEDDSNPDKYYYELTLKNLYTGVTSTQQVRIPLSDIYEDKANKHVTSSGSYEPIRSNDKLNQITFTASSYPSGAGAMCSFSNYTLTQVQSGSITLQDTHGDMITLYDAQTDTWADPSEVTMTGIIYTTTGSTPVIQFTKEQTVLTPASFVLGYKTTYTKVDFPEVYDKLNLANQPNAGLWTTISNNGISTLQWIEIIDESVSEYEELYDSDGNPVRDLDDNQIWVRKR
jgi:hypothetical protein